MGSPCLFTRQRTLKMGYFYLLGVKNSNHLSTELSLGYLKEAQFYLESKASFIDISSIASFKLFLIAWLARILHFFGQFRGPRLGQNSPNWELFIKKNVFHYQTFFFFKYDLY